MKNTMHRACDDSAPTAHGGNTVNLLRQEADFRPNPVCHLVHVRQAEKETQTFPSRLVPLPCTLRIKTSHAMPFTHGKRSHPTHTRLVFVQRRADS